MSRLLKQRMTNELETFFKGRPAVLFLDYGKVQSNEAVALRKKLREDKIVFKLVKNSMARRALESQGVRGTEAYLSGPTAAAVGGADAAVLAKSVAAVAKKLPALKIKGGVVEGRAVGKADIDRLATLPSREVLISRVMACFQAPVAGVARTLNDINGRMARALGAVRDAKKEAGS